MSNDQVTYRRDDILRVLRHLNCLVVSLDRIGSSTAEASEAERAAVLLRFFTDFMPRPLEGLADARSVLSTAFSNELGRDDMDELEREMADVVYWSSQNRDGV